MRLPPRERNQDSSHTHGRRALRAPALLLPDPSPIMSSWGSSVSPGCALRCTRPGGAGARRTVLCAPGLPPTRAPAAGVGKMTTAVPTRHRKGLVVVQNIHITEFYGTCARVFLAKNSDWKVNQWEKKKQLHEDVTLPSACGPVGLDTVSSGRNPRSTGKSAHPGKDLNPFRDSSAGSLMCGAHRGRGLWDTWDLGRHGRSRAGVRSRRRAVWTCPPVWGGSGSARIAQPGAEEGESKPGLEPGGSETAVSAFALLTACGEFLNKINNVSTAGSFDDCLPIGWFKGTRTM